MDIKKIIKIAGISGAAIFILSILAVIMANFIMEQVIHNRREVIVPEIEGKTINDALSILAEKNLSLFKIAEKFDTEVPAGSIISQSPPPGLTVREGKAIEAVISSGGKVVFVPEIEGKHLRQAELLLRQAGLLIGSQTRTFSSTAERDHIVSQDPVAGEVVEKNSYVNIVVSRGPAEEDKIKKMPNLLGGRIKEAEKIIKELGLDLVKIESVINDDLIEGTVVGQTPKQGSIVNENTKVELVISKLSRSLREVRDAIIYYEVVQSGKARDVKIVVADEIGERTVFEEVKEGGSKIEVPVKVLGEAKSRIYENGILIQEKDID